MKSAYGDHVNVAYNPMDCEDPNLSALDARLVDVRDDCGDYQFYYDGYY